MDLVLSSEHQLYFETGKRLSITELVSALTAFERIVHTATPAFSRLAFDGSRVANVDVYVTKLAPGSTDIRLWFDFFFKNQRDYHRAAAAFRKGIGIDKIMNRYPAIGFIVYSAVLLGTGAGLFKLGGCKSDPVEKAMVTLNNVSNTGVINIGDAQTLTQAVGREIKGTNRLGSNALKVLHSVKVADGTGVVIDGNQALKIDKAIIQQVPDTLQIPPETNEWVDYKNTRVYVRAIDLDTEKGWKCFVPSVWNKRIPLKKPAGIDPQTLIASDGFLADLSILWQPKGLNVEVPLQAVINEKK